MYDVIGRPARLQAVEFDPCLTLKLPPPLPPPSSTQYSFSASTPSKSCVNNSASELPVAADHQWFVALCLVVREQGLNMILRKKYATRKLFETFRLFFISVTRKQADGAQTCVKIEIAM